MFPIDPGKQSDADAGALVAGGLHIPSVPYPSAQSAGLSVARQGWTKNDGETLIRSRGYKLCIMGYLKRKLLFFVKCIEHNIINALYK